LRPWLSLIAYNLGNLCGGWRCDAGRHLVAGQLAAAIGQDRRPIAQTCQLVLVATGGESSHAAVVRGHADEDSDAAVAGGRKCAQSGAYFDEDVVDTGRSVARIDRENSRRRPGRREAGHFRNY
jgi:hypothetical protein